MLRVGNGPPGKREGNSASLGGAGCQRGSMDPDICEVAVRIDRPAGEVYRYITELGNRPHRGPGSACSVESMRIDVDGTGCRLTLTLHRVPGASDEEFARQARTLAESLATLKRDMEDS